METLLTGYDAWAEVLNYPGPTYIEDLKSCRDVMRSCCAQAAVDLDIFLQSIEGNSATDLEEKFTHTFDINPVAALEVGWHVYGETYERGSFMARVRVLLRDNGVEEAGELPDHLTHVIRLLGKLEGDVRKEFATEYIIPAMKKIVDGFEGKNNPYERMVTALQTFVISETE